MGFQAPSSPKPVSIPPGTETNSPLSNLCPHLVIMYSSDSLL